MKVFSHTFQGGDYKNRGIGDVSAIQTQSVGKTFSLT